MTTQALDRAISITGTQQSLADVLGVKSPSITEWKKRKRVPAERCIAIEQATGGCVTRYELRPDVFGQPPVELREVGCRVLPFQGLKRPPA